MRVILNILKEKNNLRLSHILELSKICRDYRLTDEEQQILKSDLETIEFAGIYQKREENEEDNINYLYISNWAPEYINNRFLGLKDIFLTIVK